MSFIGAKDFGLEVAKGNIAGHKCVNKFGRNSDIDTGSTPEDVWDGSSLWLAPTVTRIHDIASSSASDASAGTGVRTVRVYGLQSWSNKETSEDVIMNGVSNVPTVSSYVIIHRMESLTAGSGGTNAGIITATAQTDGTVTAQIGIGFGQTLMAIYGVPNTQNLFLTNYYVHWTRPGGAANEADLELLVKLNADESDSLFVAKHIGGLLGAGTTHVVLPFTVRLVVAGPAIIKIQVKSVSTNNTDVGAGFNGYLVDQ